MESTGVYWKPVWHLLEGRFELMLVNARHIKQVPGRKTDVKDAEWIAQLLQHGLLSPSFVPPPPIRELRDLTRQRAELVARPGRRWPTGSRRCWRTPTSSWRGVATDVLGVSGRAMIAGLIAGRGRPGAAGRARPAGSLRQEGDPADGGRWRAGSPSTTASCSRPLLDQLGQLEGLIARLRRADRRGDGGPLSVRRGRRPAAGDDPGGRARRRPR